MSRAIHSDRAPKAIGPYSQAIRSGEWLFCSGQIALSPATGSLLEGGIEAQTRQVLDNLEAVLHAAGAEWKDVVKTTIFLASMDDFQKVNQVYGERLDGVVGPYPARATVAVAGLPRGALVEIDAVAHFPHAYTPLAP
jgi:2-iminobutanoate/2-iminopropanoate deaminase